MPVSQMPARISSGARRAEDVSQRIDRLPMEGLLRQAVFPLGAALEEIEIRGWISPLARFDEPWAVGIPSGHHSFFGVVKGQCRLVAADRTPLAALQAGDLAIVKEGLAGSLLDQAEDLRGRQASQSPVGRDSAAAMVGQVISGGFIAGDAGSAALVAAFPPVLVVNEVRGRFLNWVDQILGLLLDEASLERPETSDVINRLLGILFIRVVRHALEAGPAGSEGLLNAPADRDVALALVRIHERLDHPWTVAGLAQEVSLSRSTFAARFLLAVGKPPLHYLRDVRMQRASVLLREGAHPLKQIAAMTGYRTTSAFSAAFRRWNGKSPGEYRDTAAAPVQPQSNPAERSRGTKRR